MKTLIKKAREEDGQAIVELAITLPIIIMLLCGMIDFGWLYTNQNIIDHLAREGARYAIVHAVDANATTVITNYTKSLAPTNIRSNIIVNITFSNQSQPRLGNVTIAVNRDVNVLTPIVGLFTTGQTLNLKSTCMMKVE